MSMSDPSLAGNSGRSSWSLNRTSPLSDCTPRASFPRSWYRKCVDWWMEYRNRPVQVHRYGGQSVPSMMVALSLLAEEWCTTTDVGSGELQESCDPELWDGLSDGQCEFPCVLLLSFGERCFSGGPCSSFEPSCPSCEDGAIPVLVDYIPVALWKLFPLWISSSRVDPVPPVDSSLSVKMWALLCLWPFLLQQTLCLL